MGKGPPLSRRSLLIAGASILGAAALKAWRRWAPEGEPIAGRIVGPSFNNGHLLRGASFPPVTGPVERTTVAVVGGGISGLSAAWKLERSGLKDFRVLELEDSAGGNSRSDESEVSAYPWGAHYLPFPRPESRAVSELLRELKVELGRGPDGRPVYNDRYVCFAPEERLFIHGRWQEGLYPKLGSSARDLEQRERFESLMRRYRRLRGSDGRRAFAIPMEESSRDPELRALDRLSTAEWLDRQGFDSPKLRWFAEYGCRDDFGTLLHETSAWAGIHYYAARGEGDDDQLLTWPEGNGWLAKSLAGTAGARLKPRALAFRLAPKEGGVEVDYLETASGAAKRLEAKAAVVCLPQYAAVRVVEPWRSRPPAWAAGFRYTPWVVANLTVEDPPKGAGAAPAWDNVIYGSESLGYVDATHQSLSQDRRKAVWTYYRPLTGQDPKAARASALPAGWSTWRDMALKDLSRGLPGLSSRVRRLDVMLWGHGMVQPGVGFLWGGRREAAARPLGRIFFGHSDLSGFSLFEEAQYRGVKAAQDAMAALGKGFTPSV